MKIGVTGADGQLGCSLRKIAGGYPAHAFVYADLPEIDVTDKTGVEAWAIANGLEIIINCAAYTAVDQAENEPDAARRVNAQGPSVLGSVCVEKGIKLVHVSTDYVFDGTAQTPYTEEYPPCPANVYGSTKRQGEEAVSGSGCDALIIRTSWLYSEFGHNFVKTMLRLGKEQQSLRVVDDQAGSPTYATNLAYAILTLIDNGFSGCTIYHYCDEGITTWYDFARMIFIFAENPVAVVPIDAVDYPTPARRPAYSVLDAAKIRGVGVETPHWVASLRECVKILTEKTAQKRLGVL